MKTVSMNEAIQACRIAFGYEGDFWITDGEGSCFPLVTETPKHPYETWLAKDNFRVLNSYILEYENLNWEQSLVKVNSDNTWEWLAKEKTLADLKVGDSCFSVITGDGVVDNIASDESILSNGWWYMGNGKRDFQKGLQVLFPTAEQALEYAKKNWK